MPFLTPQQIAYIESKKQANAAASRAAYSKAPRIASIESLNPIGMDDLTIWARENANMRSAGYEPTSQITPVTQQPRNLIYKGNDVEVEYRTDPAENMFDDAEPGSRIGQIRVNVGGKPIDNLFDKQRRRSDGGDYSPIYPYTQELKESARAIRQFMKSPQARDVTAHFLDIDDPAAITDQINVLGKIAGGRSFKLGGDEEYVMFKASNFKPSNQPFNFIQTNPEPIPTLTAPEMRFVDAPVPPKGTRAVIPMNQGYKKNTGLGAGDIDALNASAQGLRTTVTRDNAIDKGVIHRLDSGDEVVFYNNKTGEALLANALSKQELDPRVWENATTNPQAAQAREDWARGEGGNPKYAKLNLYGSYSPTVLKLEDSFSKPKYNNQTLGADSVVLSYAPQGEVVPISTLSPRTRQAIEQRKAYSQGSNEYTTGEGQFFRDNVFEWGINPIRKRMDYGLKSDPLQPASVLVAQNMIPVDGGVKHFTWQNKGKEEGVIPVIWDKEKGKNVPLMDAYPPNSGLDYLNFFTNRNTPKYYTERDFNRLKTTTDLSNYKVTLSKSPQTGRTFYQVQSTHIPESNTGVKRSDMQSLESTLYGINKAQQEALSTRANTFTEVYRGSPQEPGLEAIDAVARLGGSGKWVDDAEQDLYSLWDANVQSKADSMTADDLARGGGRGSGQLIPITGSDEYTWSGSGTSSLPRLTEENFLGERLGFNAQGMPIDVARQIVRKQGPESPTNHPGYLDNSTFVPQGINSFTPASEFYSSVPQRIAYPETANRKLQRIVETGNRNTPTTVINPEIPLTLAKVNNYGMIEEYGTDPSNAYVFPEDYMGRRVANLSVQRANNTLDTTQMSSRGRWMGGGLQGTLKDRSQSQLDPLIEERRIATPVDSKYVRLLEADDPRTQQALQQQIDAYQQSLNTPETEVNPFIRQYQIRRTEKSIKPEIPQTVIEGAYLPVTTEVPRKVGDAEFYQDWLPYTPQQKLLRQHLADVRIKLGDAYYPLTPEATAAPYLLNESQLAKENNELFGKQRINADDTITYFNSAEPSDAFLEGQSKKSAVAFDAEDDMQAFYNASKGRPGTYLDPALAPTDIVEALGSHEQKIKRIDASINNLLNSPTAKRPDAISLVNSYDTIGQTAAHKNFLPLVNKVRQSKGLPPLTEDEYLQQPVGVTGTTSTRLPTSDSASITTRFMDEVEAARVAAQLETRPKKYNEVMSDDGTTYLEEVDINNVSAKDLGDIFNTDPDRKRTLQELQAQREYEIKERDRAINAYKQLMGLEATPEIGINAIPESEKKARFLEEQLQKLGLKAEEGPRENLVIARGSLPIDLPATKQLNLPVTRTSNVEVDPELIAMAEQGKRDTEAAQKLIDLAAAYRQDKRMKEIGYPQQSEENRINRLAEKDAGAVVDLLNAHLNPTDAAPPVNAAAIQRLPQPTPIPEVVVKQPIEVYPTSPIDLGDKQFFVNEAGVPVPRKRMYKQKQGEIDAAKEIENVIGRRRIRLPLNKDLPTSPQFNALSQSAYDQLIAQANSATVSPVVTTPTQEPTYITINDLTSPQGLVQLPPRVPVEETLTDQSVNVEQPPEPYGSPYSPYEPYSPPNYVTMEDLQNPQRQLPQWAIPAGVGAGLLGVAGISRYQKEQERKRQEEEMMLRRMYGG